VQLLPFAKSHGIRIHYKVEGKGPPLLLVHGLSNSLEAWYKAGYVDALKKDYQLVLMDMRGHGASDKPHNPEMYRLELLAADPIAVLDTLDVRKAHFFGYSMGSRIGFGVAKYASNRFSSFILGGADPFDINQTVQESWLQDLRERTNAMSVSALRERIIAMFARARYLLEEWGVKIPPQLEARWVTNDIDALAAFLTGSQWERGLETVLTSMSMPCLVYLGEDDDEDAGAKRWVGLMPNATFVSIPGLGHVEAFLRSDLVLPHIAKFLERANQT
jgi:pimeloyl-ACP methyl ester carboxylesterase